MVLESKNRTNSVAISILGNESLGKWKDKNHSEIVVILKNKPAKRM